MVNFTSFHLRSLGWLPPLLVACSLVACGGDESSDHERDSPSGSGGASTSGGASNVGGQTGGVGATGGTATGGTTAGGTGGTDATGGTCPEPGDAPVGTPTYCLGAACPYGECDDFSVTGGPACSTTYPGPVGDVTIYCEAGQTGGYCLGIGVGSCRRSWAVNCTDGTATHDICADGDVCTVTGGRSLCQ